MRKKINICEGDKYNRWTVIREVEPYKSQRRFLCKCDCGNESIVDFGGLRYGSSKSCGCLLSEMNVIKNTKHGKSKTRIYRIYNHMKGRCENPSDKRYALYGGRGTKICEKWRNDFMSFFTWAMSNGYKEDLTIDRIDGRGDYEPSNCRWSTWKEQNNNRLNNRYVEFNGVTRTVSEWSVVLKIPYGCLLARLNNWPLDRVMENPKVRC